MTIDKEMSKRGYNMGQRGARYMREAVRIVAARPAVDRVMMTKELYPTIAKAAGVRWECVERAMRYAVNAAQPGRTVQQEMHEMAAVVRAYED